MSVYIYLSLAWISNPARKFSHSNLAKVLPVKGGFDTFIYYECVTIISCIINAAITTHY